MRYIFCDKLCRCGGLCIGLFVTLTLPRLAMADEQWFSVSLDGNKIGYAKTEHTESAQHMLDSTHTVIDLKGAGRANQLDIELNFESDPNFNPLGFSTHVRTRDIDRLQRGNIDAETVLLRSTYSGIEQREHIAVTHDTVWPMQEMELLKTAVAQGNRQLRFKAFDAMLGTSLPVELSIEKKHKSRRSRSAANVACDTHCAIFRSCRDHFDRLRCRVSTAAYQYRNIWAANATGRSHARAGNVAKSTAGLSESPTRAFAVSHQS